MTNDLGLLGQALAAANSGAAAAASTHRLLQSTAQNLTSTYGNSTWWITTLQATCGLGAAPAVAATLPLVVPPSPAQVTMPTLCLTPTAASASSSTQPPIFIAPSLVPYAAATSAPLTCSSRPLRANEDQVATLTTQLILAAGPVAASAAAIAPIPETLMEAADAFDAADEAAAEQLAQFIQDVRSSSGALGARAQEALQVLGGSLGAHVAALNSTVASSQELVRGRKVDVVLCCHATVVPQTVYHVIKEHDLGELLSSQRTVAIC